MAKSIQPRRRAETLARDFSLAGGDEEGTVQKSTATYQEMEISTAGTVCSALSQSPFFQGCADRLRKQRLKAQPESERWGTCPRRKDSRRGRFTVFCLDVKTLAGTCREGA